MRAILSYVSCINLLMARSRVGLSYVSCSLLTIFGLDYKVPHILYINPLRGRRSYYIYYIRSSQTIVTRVLYALSISTLVVNRVGLGLPHASFINFWRLDDHMSHNFFFYLNVKYYQSKLICAYRHECGLNHVFPSPLWLFIASKNASKSRSVCFKKRV